MKESHLIPFITATRSVIESMTATPVVAGAPTLKTEEDADIVARGMIGMASDTLRGAMVLSFREAAVLTIASRMLGEPFDEVSADVLDAVGELTNIIAGHAKRSFNEQGIIFDMATPLMLRGHINLYQMARGEVYVIPFTIEQESFILEVSLSEPRRILQRAQRHEDSDVP
jgi:chemotaxis protein CheX